MTTSLVEIIKNAQTGMLTDKRGQPVAIELLWPLGGEEIADFASTLPCPLPDDVRELLSYCHGFRCSLIDMVDFTGRDMMFAHEDVFPHGLPIASDGFGNFWVVDLNAESTDFGPVYFACHDAPVILYQSPSLGVFLTELFRAGAPPHESLVDDARQDRLHNVWRTNPGVLSQADGARSADPELLAFALSLDDSWSIIDLRGAATGMGFSWGRYGPRTDIRRHGSLPIFAYRRPQGFFRRLFG